MAERRDGLPKRKAQVTRHAKHDWAPAFLEALRKTGMVTSAASEAGVGRRTAYDRKRRDEEFSAAWDEIVDRTTDLMEREAYRRAVVGVEKPVFQQGRQVGSVREYSDVLLMFMLKGRKPETYRENHHVQHSGAVGAEINVNVKLDAGQRQALGDLLRARPAAVDSTAVEIPPVAELGAGDGDDTA